MENLNLEEAKIEDQNLGEVVLISVPLNDTFLTLADGQYHRSSPREAIESELSDDELLKNLLQGFQMESVFRYLKDSKVTFQSLRYIKKDDIKEAIPPLGLRIEFREKLFTWKKSETRIRFHCVDTSSFHLDEKEIAEKGSTNQMQSSEIDESIAAAYKLSLSRDSADWEEVCHKWKLTYSMRQKDLEKIGCLELLRTWPKLSHSRTSELIKIDFQIMYPGKDQLLCLKWETFKTKIGLYYENNIHNDFCKQLFYMLDLS